MNILDVSVHGREVLTVDYEVLDLGELEFYFHKFAFAQGIVSRFMLFVPCDKSKIIHCKKARANNDMSFLQ